MNEINLVNVYSWISPLVVFMIVLEIGYNLYKKKEYIPFADAITNLGTGIGNQCMNLLVAAIVITTFGYLYEYRVMTIPTTLPNFIILLVLFDFLFYWYHRHNHTVNILWAAHMSHHTSEEFNTFVAVRASITQRLFSFIYMWPLALIGYKPDAIYAASAVQLLIAFWHHTRFIGKMGWYEIIFNTPSYHRVHHAINEKYLDKNFGEIFIIWDKMFGTYAKEEEEPIYGALTPIKSWDPNKIYVHYWKFLWDDMINTKRWSDKIRLWFMPLGWRPEDRRHVYRERINEKTFKKFTTLVLKETKIYLTFQAIVLLIIMGITINLSLPLTAAERILLSFLIWLGITNWGSILGTKKWAERGDLLFIICTPIVFSFFSNKLTGFAFLPFISVLMLIQLVLHVWWKGQFRSFRDEIFERTKIVHS